MPLADLSTDAAELVVLGSLSRQQSTGASVGDVLYELGAIDDTRLNIRGIEGALKRLHDFGDVTAEGPYGERVYVLTEKGRKRLGGAS